MSKKHKHANRKQTQSDRMAQMIADKYDRESVIAWILDLQEYFRLHDDPESEVAWAWAVWCESAPANLFNQMCEQWQAWVEQQTFNSSVYQAELL